MASYDFKKKTLPFLIRIGIGLGIGAIVIVITQGIFFDKIAILQSIDQLTVDLRYQNRYQRNEPRNLKDSGNVVIVSISNEDLKAMPRTFPFPRNYYAHLIENLNSAGAAVIGLDITFDSPREGDTALAEVLQKYNNVVIATTVQAGGSNEYVDVRSLKENYGNVFFEVNRRQIGLTNVLWDRDQVVRRYMPMMTAADNLIPTLGFACLDRYFKFPPLTRVKIEDQDFVLKDRVIPKYDATSFMLNYYGPSKYENGFRYVPFSQVIDDSTFKTKDELDYETDINAFDDATKSLFKNKIVLVGSTMPEERDYHNVPIPNIEEGKKNYAMNGVEIHATAIQNVLDGNFITILDPGMEMGLILALSLITFLGLWRFRQIKVRHVWILEIASFIIVLVLVFGIFELAIAIFSSSSILMNIVNPSVAVILAYFGTAVYQYLAEREQKAMIKGVFGHYLNPAVVNMLVNEPEKAKLGGDRRELTIFFSDIASFTTISEHYHKNPEGLVELLNEYLDEMTSIVLKYDGTLDKYEGDALMAFWGAPLAQKDHALRTCYAALEMQKRLAELRPKWKKEGKPELSARCGLNTGIVIVGNMGGKDRFDYTVIGDSVNLASRLEGANKQYQSQIMISDFTFSHVKGKVVTRELDLIQVKGKTEPVKVYELLGKTGMEQTENQKQSLELYHEGLKLYRERKWEEAIAYFQQAVTLDSTCYVAQIYTQRASLYQLNPPPDDWNGVFVMTTK
ncbi:MAG TPA: CHASE2 domain-containing protein [Bacteroidota bacterium]